jgi:NADH-quinone oxidoreductase subunit N
VYGFRNILTSRLIAADYQDVISEFAVVVMKDTSLVVRQSLSEIVLAKSLVARDIIPLKSFILIPEYLLSTAILYSLILSTWLTHNSYNLMLQKTQSEVFGVIMIIVGGLYYNDVLCSFAYYRAKPTSSADYSFYKAMLNGELAIVAKFIISVSSAIYFLISAYSLTEQKLTAPEYSILIAFSILGLLLVCNGNDLLTIYLALELISLSSYALASFKKTHCSSESGLKYFIVGSISSSFFLFGSSLLYLETSSIYLVDYTDLFFFTHDYQPKSVNFDLIDVALSFIFLSLFVKLSCAPFHLWSLDVYEESPTSSGFYFATITKLSIVIVLIKLAFHVFFKLCFVWVTLFIVVGIMSALIGALGGVRQKKLKTLLSYSSTSNIGYALIALGGLTDSAVWAVLFHVVVYQFSGLCIWSLIIIARLKLKIKKEKYNKEIGDLSLLKKVNSPLVFSFAVTLFSLAGIPPLLGFAPKIYIISDVILCNYYLAGILLVLCSIIATFYYIRIIKVLFFENLPTGKLYYPIWAFYSVAVSSLVHFLLYSFNDVKFLSIAFVGGSAAFLFSTPWPISNQKPEAWNKYERQENDLQVSLFYLITLNRIGWKPSENSPDNWYEESEKFIHDKLIFLACEAAKLFDEARTVVPLTKFCRLARREWLMFAELVELRWCDFDFPISRVIIEGMYTQVDYVAAVLKREIAIEKIKIKRGY